MRRIAPLFIGPGVILLAGFVAAALQPRAISVAGILPVPHRIGAGPHAVLEPVDPPPVAAVCPPPRSIARDIVLTLKTGRTLPAGSVVRLHFHLNQDGSVVFQTAE